MRVFSASRRRSSLVNTRRIVVLRAMALASTSSARLPPLQPPHLSEAQQELFDDIVSTRAGVVGKEALFDEQGGLRGPWNAEVASPHLGKHLERLASAVRHQNSLEPRLYEVAILVVRVHWRAQFEWYAHERLARKAGIAEVAAPPTRPRRRALAPRESATRLLTPLSATLRGAVRRVGPARRPPSRSSRRARRLSGSAVCSSPTRRPNASCPARLRSPAPHSRTRDTRSRKTCIANAQRRARNRAAPFIPTLGPPPHAPLTASSAAQAALELMCSKRVTTHSPNE